MRSTEYWLADAAKQAGVSTRSIRRWEAGGLIAVRRSTCGWRQFNVDEIRQLRQFAVERAANRRQPRK